MIYVQLNVWDIIAELTLCFVGRNGFNVAINER